MNWKKSIFSYSHVLECFYFSNLSLMIDLEYIVVHYRHQERLTWFPAFKTISPSMTSLPDDAIAKSWPTIKTLERNLATKTDTMEPMVGSQFESK
ncbi:hypothetical protein Ddye_029069 [Dipteronia dyeriana]|uniref:Uncharacterized protein n=1 Tax=Dipteronia dyeriana TaxID=168575 RepID=A0AAD9WL56_9ROSI|nr:hypothetical protein Ddye_029069 [Dipteronia dyeriana]